MIGYERQSKEAILSSNYMACVIEDDQCDTAKTCLIYIYSHLIHFAAYLQIYVQCITSSMPMLPFYTRYIPFCCTIHRPFEFPFYTS